MGSGPAAAIHAQALRQNRAFRLHGVASRNRSRALALARRFGAPAFSSPRQLIQEPSTQAVILAVPPAVQPGYLREALRRGIPVLCEKPLALTAQAARQALRAARVKPSAAGINFCYRLIPEIAWFRECVRRRVVGTPWQIQVEWILGNRLGRKIKKLPAWKQAEDQGGGVLMNYGIHVLDYLFAGLPGPRLAGSDWHRRGNSKATEAGTMTWCLPDGSVTIRLSLIARRTPTHRIRLEGPFGSVKVENSSPRNPAGPFRISTQGNGRWPKRLPSSTASLPGLFQKVHEHWERAMRKKSNRIPTVAEGLRALLLTKKAFSP